MQKVLSGVGIVSMLYLKYTEGLFPYRFILEIVFGLQGASPLHSVLF